MPPAVHLRTLGIHKRRACDERVLNQRTSNTRSEIRHLDVPVHFLASRLSPSQLKFGCSTRFLPSTHSLRPTANVLPLLELYESTNILCHTPTGTTRRKDKDLARELELSVRERAYPFRRPRLWQTPSDLFRYPTTVHNPEAMRCIALNPPKVACLFAMVSTTHVSCIVVQY